MLRECRNQCCSAQSGDALVRFYHLVCEAQSTEGIVDKRIVANLFDFSPLCNAFSNVPANLVCESHCGIVDIVVIVGIVVQHSVGSSSTQLMRLVAFSRKSAAIRLCILTDLSNCGREIVHNQSIPTPPARSPLSG